MVKEKMIIRVFVKIVATLATFCIAIQCTNADDMFFDDFNGDMVNDHNWHIPTWESPTDGTYSGRTQFRVTQNSTLPSCSNGEAIISLELFNPTGFSFYGTDLISNKTFFPKNNLNIAVRARMDASVKGIVGGMFLFSLEPDSETLHDEIDFELLTNYPDEVQTNIYANEELGSGHPVFVTFPLGGTIYDSHDYEIQWSNSVVSWYIDGTLVRTDTDHVPSDPMYFHLNIWAPSQEWAEAYDDELQPVTSADDNEIYSMNVDQVAITGYTPIQDLSLQDE